MSPLRLGVVSYLNAAPTVYGLERDPAFEVSRDVPARIAERLHAGEIDLGLIPSIEYPAGDYAIVPGIAIGSRGPVRSVILFHRVPLTQLRRVALDASSRTSVALLKVLLAEAVRPQPEFVVRPPDVPRMLADADAALVIGDPALDYEGDAQHLDLGEQWTALTGLPFVWAFWAGRRGACGPGQVARLQSALAAGLSSLGEVASTYNGRNPAFNEEYLRTNIAYALGEPEIEGLREFYRRAHRLGLLGALPELRFHGGL